MSFSRSFLQEQHLHRIEGGLFWPQYLFSALMETASIDDLMSQRDVPGVSVAVIADDRIDWTKGYGLQDMEEGSTFIVSQRGGKLLLQFNGQDALELLPETETSYFLAEIPAEVTFLRTEQGAITDLILKQQGEDMAAKKI